VAASDSVWRAWRNLSQCKLDAWSGRCLRVLASGRRRSECGAAREGQRCGVGARAVQRRLTAFGQRDVGFEWHAHDRAGQASNPGREAYRVVVLLFIKGGLPKTMRTRFVVAVLVAAITAAAPWASAASNNYASSKSNTAGVAVTSDADASACTKAGSIVQTVGGTRTCHKPLSTKADEAACTKAGLVVVTIGKTKVCAEAQPASQSKPRS
jgi:hypothetical protein